MSEVSLLGKITRLLADCGWKWSKATGEWIGTSSSFPGYGYHCENVPADSLNPPSVKMWMTKDGVEIFRPDWVTTTKEAIEVNSLFVEAMRERMGVMKP